MTPEQCKAARAWLDWSQDDLSKTSGVALSTIRDFEGRNRIPVGANVEAMRRALERAGTTFIFRDGQASGIEVRPRITERDLVRPALCLLAQTEDGYLSMSDLIVQLELQIQPSAHDAMILESRSDTRFSQIIRNMVSHRRSPTNLIGAGYANYDRTRRGLTITEKGRQYLKDHQRSGTLFESQGEDTGSR